MLSLLNAFVLLAPLWKLDVTLDCSLIFNQTVVDHFFVNANLESSHMAVHQVNMTTRKPSQVQTMFPFTCNPSLVICQNRKHDLTVLESSCFSYSVKTATGHKPIVMGSGYIAITETATASAPSHAFCPSSCIRSIFSSFFPSTSRATIAKEVAACSH